MEWLLVDVLEGSWGCNTQPFITEGGMAFLRSHSSQFRLQLKDST